MWAHFFDWPAESLIMSFGDANLSYDPHEHLKAGGTDVCFYVVFYLHNLLSED